MNTQAAIELDAVKLAQSVSDLYLALIKPETREHVIACEGDLIRAAATLNCILDECRQERRHAMEAAE